MRDAEMGKKFKRTIITNRQLNFTLAPIDLHNPKIMPYSLPDYQIDGTWNQHQSIVLDVILDLMFKQFYDQYKNIPKSWRSKSVIDVTQNFGGHFFNSVFLTYLSGQPIKAFSIRQNIDVEAHQRRLYQDTVDYAEKMESFDEHFDYFLKNDEKYQIFLGEMKSIERNLKDDFPLLIPVPKLFKNYPAIRKYKRKFVEYLQKVADTKFKMNYKVKILKKAPEYNKKGLRISAGELEDSYYNMQDFEEIFLVKIEGDKFQVNFKSILGKMILHNMVILDTDWIPDEVFELKKNTYFIYKRFLLNRLSGQNPPKEIELSYEDIKRFLDLNGKNIGGNYGIIERAFKEMQEKGLIKEHSYYKLYQNQRLYRLTFYSKSPQKKIDQKVLIFQA
jgi:hypothetical protein